MNDRRLLTVEGIEVVFQGRRVLEGVDLSLEQGEILTLIGPNGAGKTTLVRVVLGLVHPQGGRVVLRPGMRIGYVPQRLAVDETLPLTVQRFITLGTRADWTQVGRVLEETGAAHVQNSPMQAISGGETQRVLLARALLRAPQLLVLDEPVQGVDVAGQYDLYRLIHTIRDRHGCAILMVSHDLHLVMAATDRVLCLNGHVCCSGHPESVTRDPAYLALFGREGARAVAVYQHHHNHHHGPGGQIHRPGREGLDG